MTEEPRFGSYTTARVTRGRVERVERHSARLRRDATRLGLPVPDPREIEALLLDSARDAFGRESGILRIEWSRAGSAGAAMELRSIPRALGPEPRSWRAADAEAIHPGPEQRHNTKFVAVPAYDLARQQVRESGLDEVLLYDSDGRLVEGSRANLLVVTETGRLVAPDPALGAVEGLGLTIVREDRPELEFARLSRSDVETAREVLAVNCVRGVVPIVELNGRPIAGGEPGRWAERLREVFTSP